VELTAVEASEELEKAAPEAEKQSMPAEALTPLSRSDAEK